MFKLIRTEKEMLEALAQFTADKPVFADTETAYLQGKTEKKNSSPGGLFGQVRLFQAYQEGMKHAYLFDSFYIDLEYVLDWFREYTQIYHNASYDLHTINCDRDELYWPAEVHDTLYLARLAFYAKGGKFAFYECLEYAGLDDETIKSIDKKENQKFDWSKPLSEKQLTYAACDVLYLSLLWEHVLRETSRPNYLLDIANLEYAVKYSRRGVPVNQKQVKKKKMKVMAEQEKLLEALPVNPDSPKQCQEFLGVPSSNNDTLTLLKLSGHHQAGMISEARHNTKLLSYIAKYDRPLIKGFYNPCGAISGRFSCTGGDRFDHSNLQQIPRELLECLEAPPGYKFVYMDYSALELRMAVCWIGEEKMERLFKSGADLHAHTARVVLGIPEEEEVLFQDRLAGKICNFLLIYGGSPNTLKKALQNDGGILYDMPEVRKIHKAWFKEYPHFKAWHTLTRKKLQEHGVIDVETALGRKVRTDYLNDALNIPIQGSSSEVQKIGLMRLCKRYPQENLVATTHDSNTLLVPDGEVDFWKEALNDCMTEAWSMVTKDLLINNMEMPRESASKQLWSF